MRIAAVLLLFALIGCAGKFAGPPPVTAAMAGPRGDIGQLERGRKVFASRCLECHTLPNVAEHSASAWPVILNRMSKRADLTPAEHEALQSYILAVHDFGRR